MPESTKRALYRTRKTAATSGNTSPGQTSSRSRRRKGAANRRLRPSLTMAGKLANMHTMLTLGAWNKWPLKIRIFSQDVYTTWEKYVNKKDIEPLPSWITVDLDVKAAATVLGNEIGVATTASLENKSTEIIKKTSKKDKAAAERERKLELERQSKGTGGVMNLDLMDRKFAQTQFGSFIGRRLIDSRYTAASPSNQISFSTLYYFVDDLSYLFTVTGYDRPTTNLSLSFM